MTKQSIILGITACFFSMGLAGVAAAQPQVEAWQVRGDGAYASAYSEDGCRFAALDIAVNDEVIHGTGSQPVTQTGVWAGYWMYDWCQSAESYGWEYIPNGSFSGNLSGGATDISLTVHSYGWRQNPDGYWEYAYLGAEPLTAAVTWTGDGDTVRGMESWSGRWGRAMFRNRWMGTSRTASVTVNATMGTSPMAFDFTVGSLGSYQSGTVDVYNNNG